MEKTEQQIREAGKDYAAGIRSSNHSITADQAVAIANHHFNGYTQALSDMKEERKEVDLNTIRVMIFSLIPSGMASKEISNDEALKISDQILSKISPYLQQPAPSDAIDFVNHLHTEGYEWGNKRHQLYRGGKYYFIHELYAEFKQSKSS